MMQLSLYTICWDVLYSVLYVCAGPGIDLLISVADPDPDPVGSGPFWSDPDLDVWDRNRIRILALINDPISTFLLSVKAIHTLGIPVA
jgi:hypothetical protein